jgi:uncharacterized repeat protein (TIGR03803 family)
MRSSRFFVAMFALVFAVAGTISGQTVDTIYGFNGGADGKYPALGRLVQGRDGLLYGVTWFGGTNNLGTVFKVTSSGVETVLYAFDGTHGAGPQGGLVLGTDGNFYGTTSAGGAEGLGTLFRITQQGTLTVLHSFTGADDAQEPVAPPVEASDGNFYGTVAGSAGYSSSYKYDGSGKFSVLHKFSTTEGWDIEAPLIQAMDGNLYGTAEFGGTFNCGTAFAMTTSGTVLRYYSFQCDSGGDWPYAPLMQASDGNFYGTTESSEGSVCCPGVIFKLTPKGEESTFYSFGTVNYDGDNPYAGLVEGTNHLLYGSTKSGGVNGTGNLFSVALDGSYTLVYSFPSLSNSYWPWGLLQHTNGRLYGITEAGGASDLGTVFSLNAGFRAFVAFVVPTGKVGQSVQILGQGLTGASSVTFNGAPAASFTVVRGTYMTAVVPSGATTGPVVVTTPGGALTSNVSFRIIN